jgi:hypothetical protein
MSHIDDGKLNALLDGELESAEAAAVEAHIAACAECARRLAEAKRFLAEAADLLGALEMPKPTAAPQAPSGRVAKTAREVALDLDGATQQSPAIGAGLTGRPFRRGPRAQPERPGFNYASLAWAAMIVLAIGVGYLANEMRHAREAAAPAEGIDTSRRAAATNAPAGTPATGKAAPVGRVVQSGPAAAVGSRRMAAGRPGGPPAAKAPPGQGTPVVPGRSATGLGHKQLEPPANVVAGVRAPRARPAQVADAVSEAPAAPVARAPALQNARDARRAEPAAETGGAGARAAAGGAAPRDTAVGALRASENTFQRASLEEAVTRLRGAIRLIDGMRSDRVEIGPGREVAGADSAYPVVRVVYGEAGHELVLDQQRIAAPERGASEEQGAPSPARMAPGDTLLTSAPDGQQQLRWLDRSGFWLSLSGRVPADSLRNLAERGWEPRPATSARRSHSAGRSRAPVSRRAGSARCHAPSANSPAAMPRCNWPNSSVRSAVFTFTSTAPASLWSRTYSAVRLGVARSVLPLIWTRSGLSVSPSTLIVTSNRSEKNADWCA